MKRSTSTRTRFDSQFMPPNLMGRSISQTGPSAACAGLTAAPMANAAAANATFRDDRETRVGMRDVSAERAEYTLIDMAVLPPLVTWTHAYSSRAPGLRGCAEDGVPPIHTDTSVKGTKYPYDRLGRAGAALPDARID